MSLFKPELYYIADPMCSWCWGFSPVARQIHDIYTEKIHFNLVVGGLRTGGTHVLNQELKTTLSEHWKEVEKLTGQPFNYEFAVPEGFVYNTEPSCRAVVVVRGLKPEKALGYFDALHEAFYVGNRDLTNTEVLAHIAEDFGVDETEFNNEFEEESTQQETVEDFAFGQNLGIRGFPSIVLKDERGLALLTSGYQPLDALTPNLDKWLETALVPEDEPEK
jgi:putative protein-disulfide isomerase